jgi:hypothetical protein
MNPYIEEMQIEEVVNADFFEDLLNDPYFDEELYDDASFGSFLDSSNDF